MTNVAWHWVTLLTVTEITALYLIFWLPAQRWPRVMAVTVAGAIVSLFLEDASVLLPILLSGSILTICSAAVQRKYSRQPVHAVYTGCALKAVEKTSEMGGLLPSS